MHAGEHAILSVATSERGKRDDGASGGEWAERTYWHRVAGFPPAKVERIEAQVQKGTRVRLTGQVRPSSYETDKGQTRYVIEFEVGPFGDLEVLARGKARGKARSEVAGPTTAKRQTRRKGAAPDESDVAA